MAVKIFNAATHKHNCQKELRESLGQEKHTADDIAKCSCGKFFRWWIEQRDPYWGEIQHEALVDLLCSMDHSLTHDDLFRIMNQDT